MILQVGEIEYPIDSFSINVNKISNEKEILYQYRLYIKFSQLENINELSLTTQILDNYNNSFKIINDTKEYNFTNYIFEGVNIDIKENDFQINVMFNSNIN